MAELEEKNTETLDADGGGAVLGEDPSLVKQYSQADFDAVAVKERKRGIEKGQKDLLKALGLESADDVKQAQMNRTSYAAPGPSMTGEVSG